MAHENDEELFLSLPMDKREMHRVNWRMELIDMGYVFIAILTSWLLLILLRMVSQHLSTLLSGIVTIVPIEYSLTDVLILALIIRLTRGLSFVAGYVFEVACQLAVNWPKRSYQHRPIDPERKEDQGESVEE